MGRRDGHWGDSSDWELLLPWDIDRITASFRFIHCGMGGDCFRAAFTARPTRRASWSPCFPGDGRLFPHRDRSLDGLVNVRFRLCRGVPRALLFAGWQVIRDLASLTAGGAHV